MTDDRMMAELLGDAPGGPDPAFRFDVFARIAERGRRRAAQRRALKIFAGFAGVGLAIAVAQAFGVTAQDAQPLLLVAGVLGLAYLLALLTTEGLGGTLARSRALLRVRI